ncbi:M3 family oligoendopeptidase [Sphingomonas sp. MMS12-HWE2-04]|uniref:M3 family oligoendopeptidase n=1 Tax=Sphingomonas sp. MMS12-HWE2-04 TaxID=3234199 RepID=UPI00384C4B5A
MRLLVLALAAAASVSQTQSATPKAAPPDWDLSALYPSADAAAKDRAEIEAEMPGLARWKGKLVDAQSIRDAPAARSALRMRFARYYAWAMLRVSRDGSDEAAGADLAAATDLSTNIETAAAYIEPELVALGNARLAELARNEQLAAYAKTLTLLRIRASHVLPTAQEELVTSVQPLLRQPASVRDTLFNVELPYPTITIKGEPRRLGPGALRRSLTDPDRATRKAAWDAFTTTQDSFKLTQAALLSSYLSGVAWEAKKRGWASQTEMVTASDPVPAAAFSALSAEAERAARGPLTRYVALKARALQLPALATYDLAAPIAPDTRHYTIDDAKALTLAAVAPMGQEYQQRLARGFAGKWIDWHPGPTKAPGGLTLYGVASVPAYISISYSEDAPGLAIFAHEWGHWLHWDYAREANRPYETLAPETTTNDLITFVHEMLVTDAEIARAKSSAERIAALTTAIDALRSPYIGVVAQAAFDLAVRDAADKGRALTPEAISKLYCDARDRFSPSTIQRGEHDCLGWVTEPYVYYDMYFYRYLLATSAAAWFAERIAAGDHQAADRLKDLMRAGGSKDGPTLLKQAGFDVADPSAYAAMTRRIERLTAALEREVERTQPPR